MRRTTFAIVASLLYAVAIPAHATTITLADANDGGTSNFDPAFTEDDD
jgi:hypothetical protein